MTDADDAGLLGAGSVSAGVTDPTNVAVLACLAVLAGEIERAELEAEVERLRGQMAALREALEGMVGTYAPKAKEYGPGSPAVAVALAALTLVEQHGMG